MKLAPEFSVYSRNPHKHSFPSDFESGETAYELAEATVHSLRIPAFVARRGSNVIRAFPAYPRRES